jgi:DNA-binding XRE family transcriptional regulator
MSAHETQDAPRACGDQLRVARVVAAVSQDDAAAHVGVVPSTLRAAEKGRTELRFSQVVALAALYGCPIDDLVAPAEATA